MDARPNTVALETIPTDLRSSYGPNGRATQSNGQPWAYDFLQPVNGWRATPGSIRAALALDAAIKSAGGGGLRITEAERIFAVQYAGRVAWEEWRDAGRPEPGDFAAGWRTGMRSVYMARPMESGHPAGISQDWGVYFMRVAPEIPVGTNESLSALWDLARPLGWRPVLKEPKIGQSESWHFDHFGPLERARDLFYRHRSDGWRYRSPYSITMRVANTLAGNGADTAEVGHRRLAQCLIILGGAWIGLPDAEIGPMTRAGFEVVTEKEWPGHARDALAMLAETQIIRDALAAM